MRLALFGGSFNPPHRGHVALARLARKRLALDCVMVAPVAAQPLKDGLIPAAFSDRVAMAGLAFAGERGMEISLLDAPRSDGEWNYTVDTLDILRKRLSAGDKLYCILGADSLLTIRKWHKPAELLTVCDIIVGARPGFDLSQVGAALPDGIDSQRVETALPNTQLLELKRKGGRRSRLYLLTDLDEDVSATDIRGVLRGGKNAPSVLAPAVLNYIRARHLYAHL